MNRFNDNTDIINAFIELIKSIDPNQELGELDRFNDNTDVIKYIRLLGLVISSIDGGGGSDFNLTAENGLTLDGSKLELGGVLNVGNSTILTKENLFTLRTDFNSVFHFGRDRFELTMRDSLGSITNELIFTNDIQLTKFGGQIEDLKSIKISDNIISYISPIHDIKSGDSSLKISKNKFEITGLQNSLGANYGNDSDTNLIDFENYNHRNQIPSVKNIKRYVENKGLRSHFYEFANRLTISTKTPFYRDNVSQNSTWNNEGVDSGNNIRPYIAPFDCRIKKMIFFVRLFGFDTAPAQGAQTFFKVGHESNFWQNENLDNQTIFDIPFNSSVQSVTTMQSGITNSIAGQKIIFYPNQDVYMQEGDIFGLFFQPSTGATFANRIENMEILLELEEINGGIDNNTIINNNF